ncbi:tRNA guanosine(34) transglycosylase Tgt [bacterium]|nr:tRNA guanosine(34) transglycosylase Tgt [bacterium]
MKFSINAKDGKARCGTLKTDHGTINTPAFMPVGTQGSIKSIDTDEVKSLGAEIILSNAYHLYLRPGTETLIQMGGLHKFMNWQGPILVDSGGYQVLSLAEKRKVSEEGVRFQSHLDGSYHMFTPEKVIEIQRAIGADFMMPLDELIGWPAEFKDADEAAERTWRWLKRGMSAFRDSDLLYGHEQILPPIVQGSFYEELRKREAERIAELNTPIIAIGGLAVGEEPQQTRDMIDLVTDILPDEKPRYTMGIGLPHDLVDAIALGVDLFDCVVPTRNGRNATLFTSVGRMNIRNAKYVLDEAPVEDGCPCPLCERHTRAYLHHLFRAREILGLKLASAHNLNFYFRIMKMAQEYIQLGDFHSWAKEFSERTQRRI